MNKAKFDLERFEGDIKAAIKKGVKKIYIDEDYGIWEYEPAEPRVGVLCDLAEIAFECRCKINELDADELTREIIGAGKDLQLI